MLRPPQVQLFDILKSVEPVPGVQIETGNVTMTAPDLAPADADEDKQSPDERHLGEHLAPPFRDAANYVFLNILPLVSDIKTHITTETEKKEHPSEYFPMPAPEGMDTGGS